jgi:5-methylcytosine-specific restriction protein A
MSSHINRPCAHPGCPQITTKRYCDKHERQHRRERDQCQSHQGKRLYNDRRWRAYRASYLREHPLCAECQLQGRIVPATRADHIIPHNGEYELFWAADNHQALCETCHNRKTASNDGGYGNPTKRGTQGGIESL